MSLGSHKLKSLFVETVKKSERYGNGRGLYLTYTGGPDKTLGYDARGNVTALGALAFTYDMANQPRTVMGSGEYRYDGNMKRVKSVVNNKVIYNVYDSTGTLVHVDDTSTGTYDSYIPSPIGPLARLKGVYGGQQSGDQVFYLHKDHLGSTVVTSDASGVLGTPETFSPFGITTANPVANDNQAGFTGHIRDAATGLNYMQARYYDPVIGRFLSIDPVTFMDTGEPAMFNRYAYAFNDPINLTDPTGMAPGDEFDTYDEAVDDFASYVQSNSAVDRSGDSINIDSAEYGSVVSQTENEGGGTSFSYNQPNKGDRNTVQFKATQSEAENSVGTVHNHNGDGGTVSASQADAIGTPSTNRVSGRRGLNSGNGSRSGVDDATVSNTFSRHSNVATKRTFRTDILGPRQRTKGGTTRVVRGFTFRGSKPKRVR